VLELVILLIFMIVAGIVAVEIKDLLASVIALGAVGFAVAIGFIRLAAPDLAIVQIVIEVLSVVFFVAVILKTTHVDSSAGRAYKGGDIFTFVTFGVFALIFIFFGVKLLLNFEAINRPLGDIASYYLSRAALVGDTLIDTVFVNDTTMVVDTITQNLPRTGSINRVTAVILDHRGLDTLGEATVLFTAVIAALSVLRQSGRKK
jgi:multisubunit Na+/H+ antiporter MnhB subunit